jgi:glycerol kinase
MTAKQNQYVMALDLGTTGNRAILFDYEGNIAAQAYKELTQSYPKAGWVEHDALEIWRDTKAAMQEVVQKTAIQPQQIVAIGLTVQRETCLLWDKTTGQPLHPAIVWQDRRTANFCRTLAAKGHVEEIYERTGLVLDAYFSATKLHWLLDWVKQNKNVDPANLLAGTIDSWALWNLTGGKVHRTDHSNASRTMVLNLDRLTWDEKLLDLFAIPAQIMPEVQPSLSYFGVTNPTILGVEIPITAIFGDQQAALYAHGCDRPGLLKCTYGTGAFLVANTGAKVTRSHHRLLSTVAWTQTNSDQSLKTDYALEGSMFTAGSCVQWLRDKLGLIDSAAASEILARSVDSNGGVYFVPALSGLGAPHWDMNACGAFLGLTAGVTKAHLVRSVLEAIAFQAREVVEAINQDSPAPIRQLKVDGGACNNDFLMQCQADVLGIPVERPMVLDATAQGAAFGAGLTVGFWQDYRALVENRAINRVFEPGEGSADTQRNFSVWQEAVRRAKNWAESAAE